MNALINRIVDDLVDDRSKHIFNNIHGLLEAKVMLKHLYNTSVQYLLDLKLKQINYETTTNGKCSFSCFLNCDFFFIKTFNL
jgi:hypothetical protein